MRSARDEIRSRINTDYLWAAKRHKGAQREKSLSGNQVNRKWISGEQGNRGYSVQRIGILDAGFSILVFKQKPAE